MSATAAGGRPRSSRGGQSRSNLAYDLGHRGEPMPEWVENNDAHVEAYQDGRADGAPRDSDDEPRTSTPPRRSTPPAEDDNVIPLRPKTQPSPSPASNPWTGGGSTSYVTTSADSVASAALGAVLYCVLFNAVTGGWSGVKKWLSAKFTNGDGSLS
jgi:hypothetical protein